MEDPWLSVDEIAENLGIKRNMVYKWISERQMTGHKSGKILKLKNKEVDGWVRIGGVNYKSRIREPSR